MGVADVLYDDCDEDVVRPGGTHMGVRGPADGGETQDWGVWSHCVQRPETEV